MNNNKKVLGIIVQPVRMELFKLYEQMGSPQLTDEVLSELREKLFPLELFKREFEYRDKTAKLKSLCDKNNATFEFRRCCFGGGKMGFYVTFTSNGVKNDAMFIGITIDDAISWMENYVRM